MLRSRAERLCSIRHLLLTKGVTMTEGETMWLKEIEAEFGKGV